MPLTMVGVLTSVPTRMDPLCVAVELDSPWPVMDEAAMVSGLTDTHTGCIEREVWEEGHRKRNNGE